MTVYKICRYAILMCMGFSAAGMVENTIAGSWGAGLVWAIAGAIQTRSLLALRKPTR